MSETDHITDGESLDIELRPVIELVRRAVVLSAIAHRGVLEVDTERDTYERETDRFDLYTWIRAALGEAVTSGELRLLQTPVEELTEGDIATCDAALISGSSVAWSLGIVSVDRLAIPQTGDAEEQLLAWMPSPWTDLDRLARRITARPEEAIAFERERWELWFWRATDADANDDTFGDVIEEVAAAGLIPVASGDLATDAAEPFGTLAADEQADFAWLAELRLRSLNWVCGFGKDLDSVPVYPD